MPRKKGCGIAEDDPFFFVKQTWSSLPEREFPVFVEDSTRDDEELQRITPATSGASRMPPPSRAGPLCHPLSSHTSSRPLRPPLQEVDTNIVATTGGHKRSDAHPGATTAAVNTPACLSPVRQSQQFRFASENASHHQNNIAGTAIRAPAFVDGPPSSTPVRRPQTGPNASPQAPYTPQASQERASRLPGFSDGPPSSTPVRRPQTGPNALPQAPQHTMTPEPSSSRDTGFATHSLSNSRESESSSIPLDDQLPADATHPREEVAMVLRTEMPGTIDVDAEPAMPAMTGRIVGRIEYKLILGVEGDESTLFDHGSIPVSGSVHDRFLQLDSVTNFLYSGERPLVDIEREDSDPLPAVEGLEQLDTDDIEEIQVGDALRHGDVPPDIDPGLKLMYQIGNSIREPPYEVLFEFDEKCFPERTGLFEKWEDAYVYVMKYIRRKGFALSVHKSTDALYYFVCDRHMNQTETRGNGHRDVTTMGCSCPVFVRCSRTNYTTPRFGLVWGNKDHNHPPSTNPYVHAAHRKQIIHELRGVWTPNLMTNAMDFQIMPKHSLLMFREACPDAYFISSREISGMKYNREKDILNGLTPQEGLIKMLNMLPHLHGDYRYKDATRLPVILQNRDIAVMKKSKEEINQEIQDIFFLHKDVLPLVKAFSEVLILDATFGTNEEGFEVVNIIGVSSTHQSIPIGLCFVSAQNTDTFTWVLHRLRNVYQAHGIRPPTMIMSDTCPASLSAAKRIFPFSKRRLCRWHINEAIRKHAAGYLNKLNPADFEGLLANDVPDLPIPEPADEEEDEGLPGIAGRAAAPRAAEAPPAAHPAPPAAPPAPPAPPQGAEAPPAPPAEPPAEPPAAPDNAAPVEPAVDWAQPEPAPQVEAGRLPGESILMTRFHSWLLKIQRSKDVSEYDINVANFKSLFNEISKNLVKYMENTWLKNRRDFIVGPEADEVQAFLVDTSSACEGLHYVMKSYLNSSKQSIFRCGMALLRATTSLLVAIRQSHATQLVRKPLNYFIDPVYGDIANYMSEKALHQVDMLLESVHKRNFKGKSCSERMSFSGGTPCPHTLDYIIYHPDPAKRRTLKYYDFHPHWLLYNANLQSNNPGNNGFFWKQWQEYFHSREQENENHYTHVLYTDTIYPHGGLLPPTTPLFPPSLPPYFSNRLHEIPPGDPEEPAVEMNDGDDDGYDPGIVDALEDALPEPPQGDELPIDPALLAEPPRAVPAEPELPIDPALLAEPPRAVPGQMAPPSAPSSSHNVLDPPVNDALEDDSDKQPTKA